MLGHFVPTLLASAVLLTGPASLGPARRAGAGPLLETTPRARHAGSPRSARMGPTSHDPTQRVDFEPLPQLPTRCGSPMPQLLAQNKRWAAEVAKAPGLFEKMRQHTPKYLWIGCSDARVPSNQLLGLGPGEVFVQRNIANLVVNVDTNLMSVIQYAVDVLKVSDIIVCGHYECGGVRAAMTNTNHGSPLENWLRNIRDVVRLHAPELKAIADPEARYRRLVELNAMEQVRLHPGRARTRAGAGARLLRGARRTQPGRLPAASPSRAPRHAPPLCRR